MVRKGKVQLPGLAGAEGGSSEQRNNWQGPNRFGGWEGCRLCRMRAGSALCSSALLGVTLKKLGLDRCCFNRSPFRPRLRRVLWQKNATFASPNTGDCLKQS